MKYATIEILQNDEKVLGSRPAGEYLVREYDDYDRQDGFEEQGGSMFKTMAEAEAHVRTYQQMIYE